MGNLDTQYLFADVFYFHLIPSIISLSDNPSKTKSSISSSIVYASTYSPLIYALDHILRVMAREGLTEKERIWKRNLKKPFFFFIWINIFLRLTLQHCTSFACLFSRISFIYKSLWLSFQIFLFQTVPRYINEII